MLKCPIELMDKGSDNFLQAFLLLLLNDTAQTALKLKEVEMLCN